MSQYRFRVPQLRCALPAKAAPALRRRMEDRGLSVLIEEAPRPCGALVLRADREEFFDFEDAPRQTFLLHRNRHLIASEVQPWSSPSWDEPPRAADNWPGALRGSLGGAVAEYRFAPEQPVWTRVYDVTSFVATDFELEVHNDADASAQLDVLAAAAALPRVSITIRPPRGWQSYGNPRLGQKVSGHE